MDQHPKWAQLRKGQRKLSDDLRAELEADIVTAYRQMKNLRDVAYYVNRSPEEVRRVLKRHGVPLRRPGRPLSPENRATVPVTAPLLKAEKLDIGRLEDILTRPIRTNNQEGK